MNIVISQPMLFPWVGMFEQIRLADVYVHYDDVQFSKGSFTNRVQILTPSGEKWLTIPLKKFSLGTLIKEIKVSDSDWKSQHLELLQRNYSHCRYYNDLLQVIKPVYDLKSEYLIDYCVFSLHQVSDFFGLDLKQKERVASELEINGNSTDRVLKIVQHFSGTQYTTGHGAKNYLDHERFEEAGITVAYMSYQKEPYPQQSEAFTPYVSILDLIANLGIDGKSVIKSNAVNWKNFLYE